LLKSSDRRPIVESATGYNPRKEKIQENDALS
jgi:hypothetical protein